MMPLTINFFSVRDYNKIHMSDVEALLCCAVSIKIDYVLVLSPLPFCLRTAKPALWPAHTVNTLGYAPIHQRRLNSSSMEGGERVGIKLLGIPAEKQTSHVHIVNSVWISLPPVHGADWIKDAGYQSLSQIQSKGMCLCMDSVWTDLIGLCAVGCPQNLLERGCPWGSNTSSTSGYRLLYV